MTTGRTGIGSRVLVATSTSTCWLCREGLWGEETSNKTYVLRPINITSEITHAAKILGRSFTVTSVFFDARSMTILTPSWTTAALTGHLEGCGKWSCGYCIAQSWPNLSQEWHQRICREAKVQWGLPGNEAPNGQHFTAKALRDQWINVSQDTANATKYKPTLAPLWGAMCGTCTMDLAGYCCKKQKWAQWRAQNKETLYGVGIYIYMYIYLYFVICITYIYIHITDAYLFLFLELSSDVIAIILPY